MDRRAGQCARPVAGEGAGLLYCAEAVAPGRSYCPECLARMYCPDSAFSPERVARSIQPYPRPVVAPDRAVALDYLVGAEIA